MTTATLPLFKTMATADGYTTRATADVLPDSAAEQLWLAIAGPVSAQWGLEAAGGVPSASGWASGSLSFSQRLWAIEARILMTIQDEEFDVSLIPDDELPE